MAISVSQIEATLLLLSIPLTYFLIASGSEGRRQYSTFLKAFPVVGFRDEWFHSVRATFRSLFKTAEWASEGYSKVIPLIHVHIYLIWSDILPSSPSVILHT